MTRSPRVDFACRFFPQNFFSTASHRTPRASRARGRAWPRANLRVCAGAECRQGIARSYQGRHRGGRRRIDQGQHRNLERLADHRPRLRRNPLFSKLNQINTDNVKKLGLVWSYPLESSRGVEATPLVVDGIMYQTASWSVVHAIDARTGKRLWMYDPKVDREKGYKGCCDVVNRGVALWKGKVFVGAYDGRLVALDAVTGKVVWEKDTLIDKEHSYTITGAPRVFNGKVVIGNGGAEYGARGYVTAYDAETGNQAWRWFTVPGDPVKAVRG